MNMLALCDQPKVMCNFPLSSSTILQGTYFPSPLHIVVAGFVDVPRVSFSDLLGYEVGVLSGSLLRIGVRHGSPQSATSQES
jgi:hypothetical protein